MAEVSSPTATTIVLVHGGFVDGSGWEGVYKILKKDGYSVTVVQNPTISLADDVAVTKRIIARAERPGGPCGPLLWRSGDHRSRQRSKGRGTCLYRRLCPGQRRVRVHAHQGSTARRARAADTAAPGRLSGSDKAKFAASFAADVDQDKAAFMADSQVPWGVEALSGDDQRAGVEDQAELVLGRHRRQDDPTAGPASDVQARRFDSRRGRR